MALGHGSVNNSNISGRGEQLVAVMYNAVATNISCSKEQLHAAINSVTSTKFILLTQFDHRFSINYYSITESIGMIINLGLVSTFNLLTTFYHLRLCQTCTQVDRTLY